MQSRQFGTVVDASTYCSFQAPHYFRFGLNAHNAINLPAPFQDQQGRNTSNVKALRGDGVLVYIQFAYSRSACQLLGQFLDDGRNYPARSTPRRPHVQQRW